HADRGAHGAQRVVLGDPGEPERRHDAVPEQLHDAAAVGLDDGVQRLVVAVHQGAGGLRVEALVERRRADQIGEDDGDDLARLDPVCSVPGAVGAARNELDRLDQGGPAGATELRRWRDVTAAAPASTRQRRTALLAEAIGRTILVATRLAGHRHRWNVPAWHPTSFRDAGRVGAAGRPDTLRIYRSVFEWDPRKAVRNLEKHGVTFFEAASVFTDPEGLDLSDDAHSAAERRSWRIGMSDE